MPDVLLIGTNTWESLTNQEQKWLRAAARNSAVHQRKLWQKSEAESLKAVQEAGVKVTYPSKAAFAEKVEPMYDNYKDRKELVQLINKIKSTAEAL
ncbi:MAG: hypothetical protein AAFN93_17995 [Bacteroidota bacterium]